jgi:formate dehydrogenase major subunit
MAISRRSFLKATVGTVGGGIGVKLLGFDVSQAHARVNDLKISASKVSKSVCPYCSVNCGLLLYTQSDGSGNVQNRAIHVEGNPDDPTNRGTLCPKGITLTDGLNAPNRLTKPMIRKPGATTFEEISWPDALDRFARLVKETRDKTFIAKDDTGRTVNRTERMSFILGCQTGNEESYLGVKLARAMGVIALENPARL